MAQEEWRAAQWGEVVSDGRVVCRLCPRECRLRESQRGFCGVRANIGGRLMMLGYARPSAVGIDPIEKKPLHHFLPGSSILSLGGVGCNLGCRFCQNWSIARAQSVTASERIEPAEVAQLALKHHAPLIAYTYNEPTVWAEYLCDIAREARRSGLRNVMVSNGYIASAALPQVYENIDAANIDLKAFDEGFYGRQTLARLAPVLETLLALRRMKSVWLEVTTLVIPGLNDDEKQLGELAKWMAGELGPATPLHLSAFHPDYKLTDAPRTPRSTLERAAAIARESGLLYVYAGNMAGAVETLCHACGAVLIRREGYQTQARELDAESGCCRQCGAVCAGVWR